MEDKRVIGMFGLERIKSPYWMSELQNTDVKKAHSPKGKQFLDGGGNLIELCLELNEELSGSGLGRKLYHSQSSFSKVSSRLR